MAAWNPKANEIFVNAVELTSPDVRRALLDCECGSDAALREQVEKLLQAHDSANRFLQQPAPGCEPMVIPEKPSSDVGSRIGPYKLLQEIGVGGMGDGLHGRADRAGQAHGRAQGHQAGNGYRTGRRAVRG